MSTTQKSLEIRDLLKKIYQTIQYSKTKTDIGQRVYLISHCFKIVSYVICWGTNISLNQFNIIAQRISTARMHIEELTEILERYVMFFAYELMYTKG